MFNKVSNDGTKSLAILLGGELINVVVFWVKLTSKSFCDIRWICCFLSSVILFISSGDGISIISASNDLSSLLRMNNVLSEYNLVKICSFCLRSSLKNDDVIGNIILSVFGSSISDVLVGLFDKTDVDSDV